MTVREAWAALGAMPEDMSDAELIIVMPNGGEFTVARLEAAEDIEQTPIVAIIPRED